MADQAQRYSEYVGGQKEKGELDEHDPESMAHFRSMHTIARSDAWDHLKQLAMAMQVDCLYDAMNLKGSEDGPFKDMVLELRGINKFMDKIIDASEVYGTYLEEEQRKQKAEADKTKREKKE